MKSAPSSMALYAHKSTEKIIAVSIEKKLREVEKDQAI
jgi:hypothetical protein